MGGRRPKAPQSAGAGRLRRGRHRSEGGPASRGIPPGAPRRLQFVCPRGGTVLGDRLARRLLLVDALWATAAALGATFADAYLWRLGSGWAAISVFNLWQFVAMALAFPLAGHLAQRFDRVLPLRLAAAVVAAAFATLLWLGPAAPRFIALLGVLLGAGWGLYWLAFFVLGFDLTDRGNRDWFTGSAGVLEAAAALAVPPLAGALAVRPGGFRLLFAGALAAFAAVLVVSIRLSAPARRVVADQPAIPPRGLSSAPGWWGVVAADAALGLRDGVYLFAPALLVFTASDNPLELGAFVAACQAASLVANALAARFGRPRLRRRLAVAGAVLGLVAAALLIAPVGIDGLWAFGLLAAAAQPLLKVPLEACTLDVIARGADPARWRVPRTVVKEVAVNFARACSVGLLAVAVARAGVPAVRVCLMLAAWAPLGAWYGLARWVPVEQGDGFGGPESR